MLRTGDFLNICQHMRKTMDCYIRCWIFSLRFCTYFFLLQIFLPLLCVYICGVHAQELKGICRLIQKNSVKWGKVFLKIMYKESKVCKVCSITVLSFYTLFTSNNSSLSILTNSLPEQIFSSDSFIFFFYVWKYFIDFFAYSYERYSKTEINLH